MAFKMKGFSGFKYGYHKGQVGDAKKEEMNDNMYLGKGPAKPKGMMDAKKNKPNVLASDKKQHGFDEPIKISYSRTLLNPRHR
jgi:hypothetical protein